MKPNDVWSKAELKRLMDFMGKRFRKKPVVIRAVKAPHEIRIQTLEGTMTANKGDYIIEGVKCEFYPCKPDIFWKTYENAKTKKT